MNPLVILACIVQTAEVGPQDDPRCHTPYVEELSAALARWTDRYQIPTAIEAAKCYHESHFDKHARGAHGEIGICQPKPRGAIQGPDMKLTRRQLENVDTNVRISTAYLAQFVRECDRPSRWLTKYNRPARGCRPSRYSLGVLADLRAARRVHLAESRSSYHSEASGWSHYLPTSQSTGEEPLTPARTSYTEEETRPATPEDTHERLPSGRRRRSGTREQTREEQLAAPFDEP